MKFKYLNILDIHYSSSLLSQSINVLVNKGQKNLAENLIYNTFVF
jgi:ribosomal protein S7